MSYDIYDSYERELLIFTNYMKDREYSKDTQTVKYDGFERFGDRRARQRREMALYPPPC